MNILQNICGCFWSSEENAYNRIDEPRVKRSLEESHQRVEQVRDAALPPKTEKASQMKISSRNNQFSILPPKLILPPKTDNVDLTYLILARRKWDEGILIGEPKADEMFQCEACGEPFRNESNADQHFFCGKFDAEKAE